MLKNLTFPFLATLIISIFISSVSPYSHAKNEADVIFINGQIETLNKIQPQANAVAIKNEKFIAVGSNQKIKGYIGSGTKVIDLNHQFVVPGLIDGHTHPMETIWMKEDWVDTRYPDTPSVKQALQNLAERIKVTPQGQWVYVACVSASENKFVEKRVPNKAELDLVAPNNPVVVANGTHMAIANSVALEKLGATKGVTKLPHGGGVLLDKDGIPTGVITDGQGDIPASPNPTEIARYYSTEIAKLWNQSGFTSVLAITPAGALPVLQEVSKLVSKPNIRYSVSVWAEPNGQGLPKDFSSLEMPKEADAAYYRFFGVKAWVDGENDCRTGFMYEPYVGNLDTDPPGNKGTLVTTQSSANAFAKLANQNQKTAMLHCSGDAATDIGLNAYQHVISSSHSTAIKRIEHFGMFQLSDQQLQRAKKMKNDGLHISVQPIWLLELVNADYENMGAKRTETGFKFQSMIKAGLEPAAGTDMTGIYLGNIDPFKAMYASVTRQSDKGIFEPQEAISVRDALRMWTIWPAKAVGEEKLKGSIEVGKYADMAVLSKNIFQIKKEELKDVKVDQTIVGGRIVYQRQ